MQIKKWRARGKGRTGVAQHAPGSPCRKKYVSSEEEQEDLISIGTIGLMKAVDSFRPEYGNKFATYAIRCVDNELLMHLRSKKKQRKEVSMFEPIGTDKEGNQIQLVDVLEFHDKNVADEVTKREQMKKICTFMNDVLSEREAFIIRRRYGIGGNQELTQREIARALGISRSYVSRIEKRALEKLKKSDKRIKSLQKDAFYDKVNASFFMHVSVQNSHLLE